MTFTEKETVISALRAYMEQQNRKAKSEEKRGEHGKAAAARAEAGKANALMFTFAELLSIPCGEARI